MEHATRLWFCVIVLVANGLSLPLIAQDTAPIAWPQFRGINSSGLAGDQQIPVEFGPDRNVLWSTEIPSGHSSPCVWNDHVFLTTFEPESKKLEVLSVSRSSGKIRWRREIPAEEVETGHPVFNPASCTPATDGEHVVAYFGSFGLICFDFEGNEKWALPLPVARTYAGNAISPIIVEGKVILYRGTYLDHYLLAVSVATGEEIWKKEYPSKFRTAASCTGVPVVWKDQLVIHHLDGVRGHALADGKPLWWVIANTTATSTPALGDGHVYVATWHQTGEPALLPKHPEFDVLLKENDKNGDGQLTKDEWPRGLQFFNRPEGTDAPSSSMPIRFAWLDKNKNGHVEQDEWEKILQSSEEKRTSIDQHGILAVRLGGEGDVTESHVELVERQSIPEVPSPLYDDGRVYFVKNGGILTCLNATTGERLYRKRVGASGTYYASPVLCGDMLLIASATGVVTAIDVSGETPEVLAKNDFGEAIFATPAVIDGMVLARTAGRLFAIGAPSGS
jgi:outer membrane protein assembly factor BamB